MGRRSEVASRAGRGDPRRGLAGKALGFPRDLEHVRAPEAQTMASSSMASATFTKPATFAPTT